MCNQIVYIIRIIEMTLGLLSAKHIIKIWVYVLFIRDNSLMRMKSLIAPMALILWTLNYGDMIVEQKSILK